MLQTATPITDLPDAMIILKEMQSDGVDLFGGYRPLARRAMAEIIEAQMHLAVDQYLDGLDDDAIVDRRNGTYQRHLLTALGDIELTVPRTRRYCPTEVLRAYARREAEIDRLIAAGFVLGFSTRKIGEVLAASGPPGSPGYGQPGGQIFRRCGAGVPCTSTWRALPCAHIGRRGFVAQNRRRSLETPCLGGPWPAS